MFELNGKQYTLAQVEAAATKSNKTVDEYIKAVGLTATESVKTDPISPGALVEGNQAPTESMEFTSGNGLLESQEPELSNFQSVKNSFSNMFEQLGDVVEFWGGEEGQGSALEIATNAAAASIFGQKRVDEYAQGKSDFASRGLGTEGTAEAIKEYEKELAETKRTKGIIESSKEGDIGGVFAGVVNAVTNAVGSIGYTFGTALTGNIINYVANNYVEFNKLKAQNLGMSVKDLIKEGKADEGAPIAMGILSGALENVGSKAVTQGVVKGITGKSGLGALNKTLANKLFYNKSARTATNLIVSGSLEAATEILQHASDQVNIELGSVAGTDKSPEVIASFLDAVTSEEGLEAGLQGFLGGTGLSGGSYSAKALFAVRETTNLKQIDDLVNKLGSLRKNYEGVTDPTVKKGIQQEIDETDLKLSDAIDEGNLIYQSLSDEKITKIEELKDLANTAANEITQLNKKLRTGVITKNEYSTAFNSFKKQYDSVKNELVNLKLNENISLVQKEASERGTAVETFETTEEYENAYKALTGKDVVNSNGVFLGKGKILINKQLAKETFSVNVAKHEFLHNILNAAVGNPTEQRNVVKKMQKSMTYAQRKEVSKALKRKKIKSNTDVYYTEYMTTFSDLLATNKVGFEKSAFEKIGSAIIDIFKPLGLDNLNFVSGEGAYNFIKEYSSAKEPEFGNIVKTVVGDINLKEVKAFSGSQFDINYQDQVQKLGQVELNENEIEGLSESQIKDLKDKKWRRRGADAAIGELYSSGLLNRLVGSKITSADRALPNFKEDDFIMGAIEELIPHIRNFKPSENNNLSGWINSQLSNKIKQAKKTGKVGLKERFEESLDSFSEEGQERFQVASDYLDSQSLIEIRQEEENLQKAKINPLTAFLEEDVAAEYYAKTIAAANEMTQEDFNNLTFADMPDLAPDITADLFGMKLNAYLGLNKEGKPTSANFSGSKTGAQQFIYDNADTLIRLLPNGAILEGETAKDSLINTGVKIPRKLQQAFYEKQGRVTLGAGLSPFKLKDNITKEDFLATFGITTKGEFAKLKNGEARAISMIAMARLVGRLMSNTAIRVAVDLTLEQATDLRAGISIGQFDAVEQDATNDFRVFDVSKSLIKNIDSLLKSDKVKNILAKDGIDTSSVNAVDFLLVNKPKGKNAEIDVDEGIEFYKNLREFTKGLDKNIGSNKTLLSSLYGNHRDTFRGYRLDTHDYKYLTKNGKKLSYENKEDLKLINDFLFEASTKERDNAISETLADWVSPLTKKLIESYKKSLEANPVKAGNSPNSASKVKTRKNYLIPENTEEDAAKAYNQLSEHNETNELLAKALISTFRDYYHNGPGEKIVKLKTIIVSLVSNRNSVNGFRSLSAVNGVVWSPKEGTSYHMEHVESIASIVKDILFQVVSKPGSDITFKSTAVLIPKELAIIRDSNKDTKFSAEAFKKILTEFVNDPDNDYEYLGEGQFDRAETVSEMIGRTSDISSKAEMSEKKANILGKDKGKWKFFIPPSADDLMGLLYYMVGKGKQGDKDLAWIKKNISDPFAKGIAGFTTHRQAVMKEFRSLKKQLRKKKIKLSEVNSTGFTNEVAIRVYIWAERGMEIPEGDLTKAEISELIETVKNNTSLEDFAKQIINLTLFAELPAIEKNWDKGTITTDLLDYLNTSSREKFLGEYLNNAEEIFGKFGQDGKLAGPIANRLKAAYGENYIEALSDVLYRMKTGRARPSGANKLSNQFTNWINDSVGAIMFFNARSALLQQLSFVNFINFGDNNPLKAAAAFANQPQFWSDYVKLFNSDFLKERRSGLKTDINSDEIAKAAEEGRNPIRSVIASILKKGFLPTQIADSHAIALGGASFYRNKLNRFLKEGMSQEEAEKQAFLEFQEAAEESQQSSRPDRISQQQASGLGRIILAFANTPMQYARLTKKAALDLINKRGDWKTNLSKLMYYGAVQNIVFSALQTALFALMFDDEEEDKERDRYFRIANSSADGLLRGLGFGGAVVSTAKNMVLEAIRQAKKARPNYESVAIKALTLSPPVDTKIRKLMSAGRAFTYRNTREKMAKEGFSLDNPAFEAVAQVISATTNLPADRVVRKLDNLTTPIRQETELWQAISLALGYSKWDVGLIEQKTKKAKKAFKGFKTTTFKSKTFKTKTFK